MTVELLEGRRLFAVGVPLDVAAHYNAVVQDNATIRAAGLALSTTLKADVATVAADVAAASAGRASASLVRQVKVSGNRVVAAITAATNRYLSTSAAAYRKLEVAQANQTAKPTAGHAKALLAAERKVTLSGLDQLDDLTSIVNTASSTLGALIVSLESDNVGQTKLVADLQSADGDRVALSNAVITTLNGARTDVQSFLGTTAG